MTGTVTSAGIKFATAGIEAITISPASASSAVTLTLPATTGTVMTTAGGTFTGLITTANAGAKFGSAGGGSVTLASASGLSSDIAVTLPSTAGTVMTTAGGTFTGLITTANAGAKFG